MYLTVDGGGSKINAILYDDSYTALAKARSGGVNPVQNTPESVLAHICQCLDSVLKGVTELDACDAVLAGDRVTFERELRARVNVKSLSYFHEAHAGILAAACRETGFLALAGTGSDTFYMQNGKAVSCCGGWGPVMGDQGSGAWIGLQAFRSVCRELNGWGEKTLLTQKLGEYYKREGSDLWHAVIASPAPYSEAARVVPVVAEAAREGDNVAIEIFEKAGIAMGKQLEVVVKRVADPVDRNVYLCGGAWKAYPGMRQSCTRYMKGIHPDFELVPPRFEHVLAGPIRRLLAQGADAGEAAAFIADRFSEYAINQY